MSREFTVVRELSREELERHQKRFIGVTTSTPRHAENNAGLYEWVCNVRIGFNSGWYVIKDCLISQQAFGVVNDMNIPVLCERSEAGRVTIIGRSEVMLPDIVLNTYTHYELGLGHMAEIQYNHDDAEWQDAFGNAESDPTSSTGSETTLALICELIPWDDSSWEWGVTAWGAERCTWE